MVCGRKIKQSELCSRRSFATIHGWYFQSQAFRQEMSRAITLPTDYSFTSGFSKLTQFLLVCTWVRYGLLLSYNMQDRDVDNPIQKWLLKVLKWFLESETPLLSGRYVMRDCGLESLQFSWFRAAMCLYNFQTQCKSSTRSSAGFVLQCVCTIF
jgi:hypothetical protein